MEVALKSPKPEAASAVNRRTRVSIPIIIRGKDISGRPFEQPSHTLVATNRGLLIEAIQQLWLGAEIELENPALGRKAVGRVVWWPSESALIRANEVGIYMAEAEDFCGVVPGAEPDTSPAAVISKPAPQPVAAVPPVAEPPVAPAPANGCSELEAAPVETLETVAPPEVHAETVQQAEAADLTAPISESSATTPAVTTPDPAPATPGVEEAPPSPAEATAPSMIAHLDVATVPPQETTGSHPASDELERQAAGIEQRVMGTLEQKASSLEARLEGSRSQAEAMLARLEELRERAQSRLVSSASALERTMLASLEQQAAPIGDRIERSRAETEAMLAELADTEKRTTAHLQESVARAEQSVVETVERQLGSVDARLEGSRTQVEALLARLDELQKAGDAEVARVQSAIPEAGGQAIQFALEGITGKIRTEMESVGASVVEETRDRVHREGAAAIQAFIESGELEANLERVLQSQGAAIFGQFQKDSDHLSHQTVAAMQQKSDEILRAASGALSEQAASAQGSLQTLITSSSAELRRTAEQAMQQASDQFADRQKALLTEAADNLRHTVDGLIESAGSQMRGLAEANLQRIDQQLAAKQKAFVEETVKAFREKLGEILMKD